MHSEGILCGELKHGPLAMIDPSMPVIMVATHDNVYTKVMNGIQQVNARQVSGFLALAISFSGRIPDNEIELLFRPAIYINM